MPKFERPSHDEYNHEAARQRARRSYAYWAEGLKLQTADAIAEIMDREGMSRTDLANALDNSPSFITKILRGEHNFSLETLAKVAFALGYKWNIAPNKIGNITKPYFVMGREGIVHSRFEEESGYTESEAGSEVSRADQLAA